MKRKDGESREHMIYGKILIAAEEFYLQDERVRELKRASGRCSEQSSDCPSDGSEAQLMCDWRFADEDQLCENCQRRRKQFPEYKEAVRKRSSVKGKLIYWTRKMLTERLQNT